MASAIASVSQALSPRRPKYSEWSISFGAKKARHHALHYSTRKAIDESWRTKPPRQQSLLDHLCCRNLWAEEAEPPVHIMSSQDVYKPYAKQLQTLEEGGGCEHLFREGLAVRAIAGHKLTGQHTERGTKAFHDLRQDVAARCRVTRDRVELRSTPRSTLCSVFTEPEAGSVSV